MCAAVIARGDPSRLVLYRLVDVVFKMIQWTAFAGLVRVVGLREKQQSLVILGWFLLSLVVIFLLQAVHNAVHSIYGPGHFKLRDDRTYAYAFSILLTVGIFSWLVGVIFNAADWIATYYVGK